MEKSHSCKCHYDSKLVAAVNNILVSDGTARLRDVACAALVCSLNVVKEWEEGIRSTSYSANTVKVCSLLLFCESLRLLGEVVLPDTVCTAVLFILVDVSIDDIVSCRSSEVLSERKVKNLLLLAKEPCI